MLSITEVASRKLLSPKANTAASTGHRNHSSSNNSLKKSIPVASNSKPHKNSTSRRESVRAAESPTVTKFAPRQRKEGVVTALHAPRIGLQVEQSHKVREENGLYEDSLDGTFKKIRRKVSLASRGTAPTGARSAQNPLTHASARSRSARLKLSLKSSGHAHGQQPERKVDYRARFEPAFAFSQSRDDDALKESDEDKQRPFRHAVEKLSDHQTCGLCWCFTHCADTSS